MCSVLFVIYFIDISNQNETLVILFFFLSSDINHYFLSAETGPILTHRRSWVDNTNMSMKGSFTDLSNLDLDSVNSTPAMQRVSYKHKKIAKFIVFRLIHVIFVAFLA
jgi:hypothetical protein